MSLCVIQKSRIKELEVKLALTEKALELACEELRDYSCIQCNSCDRFEMCNMVLESYTPSDFKERAKEMMKSE